MLALEDAFPLLLQLTMTAMNGRSPQGCLKKEVWYMTATRPNRRHILKRAGALGALAALFSPTAAFALTTTGSTQSLEGGWRTTITLQGNAPFQGLITFAAGGGLVDTQQIDLSQQGTPGIGSWVGTGGGAFALNFFKIASDNKGNLSFTVRFVITVQLSGDQNAFNGSGTFTVFDPNGNNQVTHTLQFDGTRLQA
jgi:hypothetical protein